MEEKSEAPLLSGSKINHTERKTRSLSGRGGLASLCGFGGRVSAEESVLLLPVIDAPNRSISPGEEWLPPVSSGSGSCCDPPS